MEKFNGAEIFLQSLYANGIERVFLNPGLETIPVQAAAAGLKARGKPAPEMVLCLDESVAAAAAHGYYMVSGKIPLVMVHMELGTMQVGGALHNAVRGRVPLILCAGKAPPENRANQRKEEYDQGCVVRNCVQKEIEINPGDDIEEKVMNIIDEVTLSPTGPVYLLVDMDIYQGEFAFFGKHSRLEYPPSPISVSGEAALTEAAGWLVQAENPLIMAGQTGKHADAVASLITLAETLGAKVLPGSVRMNFPSRHPLWGGIEAVAGSRTGNPAITAADVLLLIDYDLPYAAAPGEPGPDARIIRIDADRERLTAPLWREKSHISVHADSRVAIPALQNKIAGASGPDRRQFFKTRFDRLAADHVQMRLRWQERALNEADWKPVSPDWLCRCINQMLDENTIVINQTVTHAASVFEQIYRDNPHTLLSCPGGSMGWAPGAALGAKIAAPDKNVVALMGDGSFIYSCPEAVLWSALRYQAPFLCVIFNNQGYGAVREGYRNMCRYENLAVDISPSPDYALIAQGCGAFGRRIEEPSHVLPALKEAFASLASGRAAVLDVRLDNNEG